MAAEAEKGKQPIPILQEELTPRQIVEALNEYIVGQEEAKRAVAIALRNRIRRQMLPPEMQEEVTPKNILMIGPTGVGKTEIARRLARLVRAPFVKVEASKFTEVGYVGRDVESIIRDLTEAAVAMVRQEYQEQLRETAEQRVEERLLDALLPETGATRPSHALIELLGLGGESNKEDSHEDRRERLRERFREMLRNGELEDRPVEIEVEVRSMPFIEILSPAGHEEMDINLRELLGNMLPKQRRRRRVTVAEARQILLEEEMERLTDMDRIVPEAIRRVEQSGIVFLDEIDKIAGRESTVGPDVSREGVQRDILPIVEGCTVTTKYGPVRTDHILFIAAGAFHVSKPSDLIPELQGRFPIRVELNNLTEEDFRRILTDPKNSLIRQYAALLATEGVTLEFTEDAITEMAKVAYELNSRMENIGARRLHTILERVLETISFTAPERQGERIVVDRDYVREQLRDILENVDLSRYIL